MIIERIDARSGYEVVASKIRDLITNRVGYCMVENLKAQANNQALLQLCRAIGSLAVDSIIKQGNNIEKVYVQKVEYNPNRLYTHDNFLRNSAYNGDFACHTDCASEEVVPDIMLLQCVQAASHGGESLILHVDDIIEHLSVQELELLQQPIFPFGFGYAAILVESNGKFFIRYNKHEINKASQKLNLPLTPYIIELLDTLDHIISYNLKLVSIKIQPDECLVVNNRRILHGRTKFPHNSKRLLYRVRLFLDK